MGIARPPLKNLSVSKIEKAMLCPKHYKLKFLDRIPEMSSWVAHGGIVVHDIVEKAIKQFAHSGSYPSWQELDDRFMPTWEEKRRKTESNDDFLGWKEDPKEPVDKVLMECRPLVRLAREEALPKYQPWMLEGTPVVEQRIDLELESAIGSFPIIGYIDLLDASGTLVDWKTTGVNDKGEVSDRKLNGWLQNAAYSLWAWPIVGEEYLPCQKVFLVKGQNGLEPRVQYSNFKVGPQRRRFFTDVAASVWEMTVNGGFPANTNTWMCRPDWCTYFQMCRGEAEDESGNADADLI